MTALALVAFGWAVLVTALLWRVARAASRIADRVAPRDQEPDRLEPGRPSTPRPGSRDRWEDPETWVGNRREP